MPDGWRAARAALWSGVLAASLAAPLAAAPDSPRINYRAEAAAIGRFQDQDQRLQDIGWKLTRGNAAFCARTIPAIGLQLQDMASYGRPDIARTALQLTGDFAVQTVAKGSPADQAGGFSRNREVTRLGPLDPNQWPAGRRTDWQRLARAHDYIDSVLGQAGGIAITFADGMTSQVTPVTVCTTRFELMGEGSVAVADGNRVVIGISGPALSYDEPLFASLIAHELAHNLLGHTAWLDRNGRGWSKTRRTEREADRLIPWLLANAGYDPAAAARFMQVWGPAHGPQFLRAPTHDGWAKRLRAIEGELPLIAAVVAREGRADWSRHFRREINPDQGL